ncbi:hypothetical protein ACOSP7_002764 [Xanthoceras sorbifolium]
MRPWPCRVSYVEPHLRRQSLGPCKSLSALGVSRWLLCVLFIISSLNLLGMLSGSVRNHFVHSGVLLEAVDSVGWVSSFVVDFQAAQLLFAHPSGGSSSSQSWLPLASSCIKMNSDAASNLRLIRARLGVVFCDCSSQVLLAAASGFHTREKWTDLKPEAKIPYYLSRLSHSDFFSSHKN